METSWTIFEMYIAIFGLIVTVGILNDKKGKGATQLLLNSTRARLAGCASRFNQQVKALQREYKSEKKHGARLKTYEIKYNVAKIDYDREANEIIREWKQAKKDDMWWRGFWKIVIVTGVISLLGACTEALVNIEENSVPASMEQMTQARDDKVWTAQSIPMPHLTDGRRYVSNPDGIVSDETVRRLDAQLKQLDDSLGIESVLVIVSRVENGDIFRFAQDIFDEADIRKLSSQTYHDSFESRLRNVRYFGEPGNIEIWQNLPEEERPLPSVYHALTALSLPEDLIDKRRCFL